MAIIKVLQYDEDAQEAVAEIATSLHDAAQLSQVSLRVFCQPISSPVIRGKISLFGFLVTNVVSEYDLQVPIKTNYGYFSYRLFAKVLDVQRRCVQLGDIEIELDCPIPKDIPVNSYISFDVARLDLKLTETG